MTYASCPNHTDYARQNCPDCHAARSSSYLRMVQRVRAGVPTPAEQEKLDELRERYEHPDWRDRYAPAFPVRSMDDVLDAIERSVQGEVE
jgi:hypothetical protein